MQDENLRDEELRARLVSTLRDIPTPEANLGDVARRARAVRTRRYLGAASLGAIVLVGLALPLMLLGPLAREDVPTRPASASNRLDIGGIQVAFPEDWDGRVYYIAGYTRPIIRVASFDLPESDDVTATSARSRMKEDDALIALTEYSAICPPCPGFDSDPQPTLNSLDFSTPFNVWNNLPPREVDVPDAHTLGRRTFQLSIQQELRFFDLWVEFGTNPPPEEPADQADEVLSSIEFGHYAPPEQPDELCNEWSPPKDPDCPSTIWLESVLVEAGYQSVDDPDEQTMVGTGGGARFFIWVRESEGTLEDRGYPLRDRVDDVAVYGGQEQLVWRAQGFDVWIASGPYEGNRIPELNGVRALVRATIQVPYGGS
ncbi:MAG: hypothetical protein ACREA0_01675 [bacterium]